MSQLPTLKLKRLQLLKTQTTLSQTLNNILTSPTGLNTSSAATCKNLIAAITVSKRPGFFEYYKRSEGNVRVEVQDEIRKLVNKIKAIQIDIDRIDMDIKSLERDATSTIINNNNTTLALASTGGGNVNTLGDWLNKYGAPSKASPDGFMSSFTTDPKIYGGSKNYGGFKTQGKKMRLGRITR